jgi:hypothetical protein
LLLLLAACVLAENQFTREKLPAIRSLFATFAPAISVYALLDDRSRMKKLAARG